MREGGSIVFYSQFCNGNKMKNARLLQHGRRMIMNEKVNRGGIKSCLVRGMGILLGKWIVITRNEEK
jgi:hypothetical protein